MLNSLHHYYKGVGSANPSSGLPMQTLPKSKKNSSWEKENMDRLEQIGVSQRNENLEFRDYYRMVEGRLVYADYQPTPEVAREIVNLRNEVNLPSYLKHFDLIGMIVNQIIGEYENHKDKVRVDSLDAYAQNEYTREKTRQLREYIQQSFQTELKLRLAQQGIAMDKNDFKSEEERQAYIQKIEQEKAKIVPPEELEKNLNKNFKVKIVEWAEHVLRYDRTRFSMNLLEKEELKDFLLTGRFFRHYRIGYDHYEPEHWRVEETFFSRDSDIKYPQDGEYVGRVFDLSPSRVIERYGHLLSHNDQVKITKSYTHSNHSDEKYPITNPHKRPVKETLEPLGYQNLELLEELQEAFGAPLGEETHIKNDGSHVTVPAWIEGYNNDNYATHRFSQHLRDDFTPRKDTIQVTEAYWRSQQLVGYIYYRDEQGTHDIEMVTEDILKEFIKENNIKQLKSTSIEEFMKKPEVDTIAWTYIPQIYQGKKLRGVNTAKGEDIYFDIKPLEYQVKGNSSLYDPKLPVAGIISSSFARKIRPYQFGYNVAWNQITNLLEKEIGMFFLMDIQFLPSEFKEMGDSKTILSELREMAKEIGFMPVDTSKKNLETGNPNTNSFIKQNITYGEEVKYRMELAERYKVLALEQIGITPQRMGSPTHGETAEGVRQGVSASYAQTDSIYSPFNEAVRKAAELHLAVAQYAEKNDKEISIFYRKGEEDLQTMKFSDDKFHLRELGVEPITDSNTRKHLEQLRNVLLNNNTMGNDMLDYAELFASDSMSSLISIGRRNRLLAKREVDAEREHESNMLDKQMKIEEAKSQREWQRDEITNQRDRDTDLEGKRISALGRAVDDNADSDKLNYLAKITDQSIKRQDSEAKNDLARDQFEHQKEMDKKSNEMEEKDMALRMKEIQAKMAEIKKDKSVARINKN